MAKQKCTNPQCSNPARTGSKYCEDTCRKQFARQNYEKRQGVQRKATAAVQWMTSEEFEQKAEQLLSTRIPLPNVPAKILATQVADMGFDTPQHAVACFSDYHYGGVVDPIVTGGIGGYDTAIARYRLADWRDGVLRFALALDTPILTNTGWKGMGSIEVGDRVFGTDGKLKKVKGVSATMNDHPCFRVNFSDDTFIIADAAHVWRTSLYSGRRKHAKKDWCSGRNRTTQEIYESLDKKHAIYLPAPLEYPQKTLPIPGYVLGVWLGDGAASGADLTTGDSEIAEEIRGYGYAVTGNRPKRYYIKGLLPQLRALGVLNNKHIPRSYLTASITERWELLQGLVDSDGTVKTTGSCVFTNTNKWLVDGFIELSRSLAMPTRARPRNDGSGAWDVAFIGAGKSISTLPRKQERVRPRPNTQYKHIVSVEPVPSVPVRCIETTAKNGLYLAGYGMTPTHNTQMMQTTLPVPILHLLALGDDMEGTGHMYGTQAMEMEISPYFQFLGFVADMTDVLVSLLSRFEKIHIYKVFGNHGRLAGRKKDAYDPDNYELMAWQTIAARCELAAPGKFTFDISPSFFQIVDILGYSFYIRHGDGVNLHSTYVGVQDNKLAMNSIIGEVLNYMVLGHHHTASEREEEISGDVLSNGCFVGPSLLALKMRRPRANRPSQEMFFVHPEKGLTHRHRIHLATEEEVRQIEKVRRWE